MHWILWVQLLLPITLVLSLEVFNKMQVAPKASFEKQQGTSGKNAKRMRKAMQQLEQEENAPKKAKTYTSAEIAEGVK